MTWPSLLPDGGESMTTEELVTCPACSCLSRGTRTTNRDGTSVLSTCFACGHVWNRVLANGPGGRRDVAPADQPERRST